MRLVNRVLALLLGLALAAGGVIVLVEAALRPLGRAPWLVPRTSWDQQLRSAGWDEPWLVAGLVIALCAGLLLLAAALWPRRPDVLALRESAPDRTAALDRRGLQRHLRQVATGDDEVVGATIRVRRRRVKVRADVPPDVDAGSVRTRLRERLTSAIDRLELQSSYRTSVDTRRVKERVR